MQWREVHVLPDQSHFGTSVITCVSYDIAMVAMEGEYELIRDLSNGAISNDLE